MVKYVFGHYGRQSLAISLQVFWLGTESITWVDGFCGAQGVPLWPQYFSAGLDFLFFLPLFGS